MFVGKEELGIPGPVPTSVNNSKLLEQPAAVSVTALQLENAMLKEKIALLERYLERLERTHDTLLGKF